MADRLPAGLGVLVTPAEVLATAKRAIEALPPGPLTTVLGVLPTLSLREDDGVGTASMSRRGRGFVMTLSPSFCINHVSMEADALVLVAHEVLHALRGHLDLRPPAPADGLAWNIALDVLVNGQIVRRLVPGGCEMYRHMYQHQGLPGALLLPPADLLAELGATDAGARALSGVIHKRLAELDDITFAQLTRVVADRFASLGSRRPEALARLYLDGWLGSQEPSAWVERFVQTLSRCIPSDALARAVTLLGDHSRFGLDALPRPCSKRHDAGTGDSDEDDDGEERDVQPREPSLAAWATFSDGVERALVRGGLPESAWVDEPTTTVLARPGRRDLVWLASGCLPAIYHPSTSASSEPAGVVHLYVDVSGSTEALHPAWVSLAQRLGTRLAKPTWGWSGAVHPVHLADLRRGVFRSNGATRFDLVLRHAHEHRFERILVLTDGEFDVDTELVALAAKLPIVFVTGGQVKSDLARLGVVLTLPEVSWAK